MSSSIEPDIVTPTSSNMDSVTKNPEDGSYDYDYWKKAFVSQPTEFDYFIPTSDIDGEIPEDLHGTLFRNRPALFERGTHNLIYVSFFEPKLT